jgi:hypothetical protein
MSYVCCFCERPVTPIIRNGQKITPTFCSACKAKYDAELDEAWHRQEWAKEMFRMCRQEQRQEVCEADYVRLDGVAGQYIAAHEVVRDTYEPIYLIASTLVEQHGWGNRRLHAELVARGHTISRRHVCRLIKRIKAK